MAESMIERVANVLATRRGSKAVWEEDIATARAAIGAMREITDVMADVSCDIVVGYDDFAVGDGNIYLGIPGYPQKAQEVWGALIDAALSEQVAG